MSIIYFRLKFTLKKIIPDSKMSPDFSYFKGIHYRFSPDSESRIGTFLFRTHESGTKHSPFLNLLYCKPTISYTIGRTNWSKATKILLTSLSSVSSFSKTNTCLSTCSNSSWTFCAMDSSKPPAISRHSFSWNTTKNAEKSGGIRVASRESRRDLTGYQYPDIFTLDER